MVSVTCTAPYFVYRIEKDRILTEQVGLVFQFFSQFASHVQKKHKQRHFALQFSVKNPSKRKAAFLSIFSDFIFIFFHSWLRASNRKIGSVQDWRVVFLGVDLYEQRTKTF